MQTRLRKLGDGVASATFLAMAGLRRLNLDDLSGNPVDPADMLPAIAQGAIGIEQRSNDDRTAALLAPVNDTPTQQRLAAERALLLGLDGSCQTPIAGLAEFTGPDNLRLRGEILRPDGSESLTGVLDGPVGDAAAMGAAMAADLRGRAGEGFFD